VPRDCTSAGRRPCVPPPNGPDGGRVIGADGLQELFAQDSVQLRHDLLAMRLTGSPISPAGALRNGLFEPAIGPARTRAEATAGVRVWINPVIVRRVCGPPGRCDRAPPCCREGRPRRRAATSGPVRHEIFQASSNLMVDHRAGGVALAPSVPSWARACVWLAALSSMSRTKTD
jgi:hypothetical protein